MTCSRRPVPSQRGMLQEISSYRLILQQGPVLWFVGVGMLVCEPNPWATSPTIDSAHKHTAM